MASFLISKTKRKTCKRQTLSNNSSQQENLLKPSKAIGSQTWVKCLSKSTKSSLRKLKFRIKKHGGRSLVPLSGSKARGDLPQQANLRKGVRATITSPSTLMVAMGLWRPMQYHHQLISRAMNEILNSLLTNLQQFSSGKKERLVEKQSWSNARPSRTGKSEQNKSSTIKSRRIQPITSR